MTKLDALPHELWPLACRAATGGDWPPRTDAAAQSLIELAYRHRLLPLLSRMAPVSGPLPAVLERSRALARASDFRLKTLRATLQRLVELIAPEEFILFKGCDFAFRLYPDPELRPMSDIDVLVPARTIPALRARLETAGLVPNYSVPASRAPSHHEFVFRGAGSTIEIHQAFLQNSRHGIDYEQVWARRQPHAAIAAASRLADCDAVLSLCVAVAGDHLKTPLIRFVDLHLLLARDPAVVETTISLARSWKCERAVYATLRRYLDLFPDSSPPVVREAVGRVLSPRTRDFIRRRVLPEAGVLDDPRHSRSTELWRKFWLMDDAAHRFRFLAHHVGATAFGVVTLVRNRAAADQHSDAARQDGDGNTMKLP